MGKKKLETKEEIPDVQEIQKAKRAKISSAKESLHKLATTDSAIRKLPPEIKDGIPNVEEIQEAKRAKISSAKESLHKLVTTDSAIRKLPPEIKDGIPNVEEIQEAKRAKISSAKESLHKLSTTDSATGKLSPEIKKDIPDVEDIHKGALIFSAKEFRQKLSTADSATALEESIALWSDKQVGSECIYEYLKAGGSCLEIMGLLEEGTNVPQFLVLSATNLLLLQIIANYPKHRSGAYEACRYFLNSHIMMINKMLGLSSSGRERLVVLKFLTAIIMFSDSLAKEILLHVNFHSANLELLTKHVENEDSSDSVRNTFIHFLVAFLVNDHYPTISLLLGKRGLLSSIINGLRFDVADSVCMVVTTLKTNILENPLVSKTVKMKTFSTSVVKDIVNLYNWRGPAAFSKKRTKVVIVNEVDKSRVSECVHNFLLTLCTSHKFGVIFRDRNLTNPKKHQNALMHTVLESLQRPWEHSYACELITKICAACPDLVKTMWSKVKPFLVPRSTVQWLNAIKFSISLIKELHPVCIEYCVKDLTAQQYAQSVQMLVAPTMILNTLLPKSVTLTSYFKQEIVTVVMDMLQAVRLYMDAARVWFPQEFNCALKNLLHDHLSRNFPTGQVLFFDWNSISEEKPTNFPKRSVLEHLDNVLNTLENYSSMCPTLLDSLLACLKFSDVLEQISLHEQNVDNVNIRVKLVKVFIKFEPSLFSPNTDIFESIMPVLLETYYNTKCKDTKDTLYVILNNTGIFEGCELEINIWINSIFSMKSYTSNMGTFFVNVLKHAYENVIPFLTKIAEICNNQGQTDSSDNVEEVLESLKTENQDAVIVNTVKHTYFSPLLIAALEKLEVEVVGKNMKRYINYVLVNIFHYQTNYNAFNVLIIKYLDIIPEAITNYFRSWDDKPQLLDKGTVNLLDVVSATIIEGEIRKISIECLSIPEDFKTDILRLVTFYVINLKDMLTENVLSTCLELVNLLIGDNFGVVLTNASLLQNFAPLHIAKKDFRSFRTLFVMDVVQLLRTKGFSIDGILNPYRSKLYACVLKLIDKEKVKNVGELHTVIETFGFNFLQSKVVLERISDMKERLFLIDTKEYTIIYNICNYALCNYTNLCIDDNTLSPLNSATVTKLGGLMAYLNLLNADTADYARAFLNYLNKFPHDYQNIPEAAFESILCKQEYCKENSLLAVKLIEHRVDFIHFIEDNIEVTTSKKGLFLPILDSVVKLNPPHSLKEKAYKCFEPSILKVLQKPQKAGQHFEKHYKGLCNLIKEFIPEQISRSYLNKVHKFDSTEVFHAHMLGVIFDKFANNEKTICNAILTFTHLFINLFKQKIKSDKDILGVEEISQVFINFAKKIAAVKAISLEQVHNNESYKLFSKFCLKFGIGSESYLIELQTVFMQTINYNDEEIKEFMDMITSHSEFVSTILNVDGTNRKAVLDLILIICTKYPSVMHKYHLPLLLGAYSATTQDSDKTILQILKLYESVPAQTSFYDFKPILWGTAASNHYSVRSDIQKALWRQPRTGDVLDILQESWILDTVKHYPLNVGLEGLPDKIGASPKTIYDLRFLLPLFSQLLAPENSVQTYRFTKCGALGLTIGALSSDDTEVRMAACHVLARFHFHLEAKTSGKDNMLWMRFVEAVCRGTAVFEDFKLNNFVSVFLARMALILTKPQEAMYVPLTQYLGAKLTPNLSSIPELYTFLHSSDINFKEYHLFILEVLRDGLRTDRDFDVFVHAMTHKLLMEMFSSVVSDREIKLLILEVIASATAFKYGVDLFCSNYGLLSWLNDVATVNDDPHILSNVLIIVYNIIQFKYNDLGVVELLLCDLIDRGICKVFTKSHMLTLLKCTVALFKSRTEFLTESRLSNIVTLDGDQDCKYMIKYKYNLIGQHEDNVEYYMKLLVHNWQSNK